ncbi:MAG: tRNA (adenosine(37)-N6)-dimethylallyltransferase MiaA [Betaproteobacteria bacterium]|nr:tRNA (adenosine(37)-N6)-dimethylallyltransferase MiaA [Betaproteobacteria bacterium]
MARLPPAVFLLGPTASGKTALALALAARFPLEIVSVDSALVYRDMDIGTAKPDRATLAAVPHHLVDIVPPTEAYSAGRFREDALLVAGGIAARGRVPVFAGGTMLYERALMRGLARLPAADPAVRAEIDREARLRGWPALHAELAKVDPESAARLDPNDAQRIQRALEVWRLAGASLTALIAGEGGGGPPFAALTVVLEPSDRALLHRRIEERFRAMLAQGLVDEVVGLRARYALDAGLPSMRAVGYRQVWETLEGQASAATLEARGVAATRQLAKRQLTWLRAMREVERLDCLRPDLEAEVAGRVGRFLDGR